MLHARRVVLLQSIPVEEPPAEPEAMIAPPDFVVVEPLAIVEPVAVAVAKPSLHDRINAWGERVNASFAAWLRRL